MQGRPNKRKLGSEKERVAGKYLEQQGYTVLEYNFYSHGGEIDIVAKDSKGTYVMCEVKYRSSTSYGEPVEAVNYYKQKNISHATLYYYLRHQMPTDTPCRFDVIGIERDGTITHIKDAFSFCE